MGDYFDFLLCNLTANHKKGELKVSNEVSLSVREQNSGFYESVYVIGDSKCNENWWILKFNYSDSQRYRFRMTRTDRLMAEYLLRNANNNGGLSTD